ncbi:MAG: GEVED domain-containing protein, partial [Bacteroidota bacterium]
MALIALPATAQTRQVKPVFECVIPQGGGSHHFVFGWEYQTSAGTPPLSKTLAWGNTTGTVNSFGGGTLIIPTSGNETTFFDYPIGSGGSGQRRHVVWPPFVNDGPGPRTDRTGRSMWWTNADMQIQSSGSATRRLDGNTQTTTLGANTQRCSQHVFIEKLWNGSVVPPQSLDKQTYELHVTFGTNPVEPSVTNTATAICKYLEYQTPSTFFAPYGEGFTTTPSNTLNCAYQNALPYGTDIGGYWVPKGSSYVVSEQNAPSGFTASNLGTFIADFESTDPSFVAECEYYPAFGTTAAIRDSDNSDIPKFGRASSKWCLHTSNSTSSTNRDYGDAPDSYSTLLASNGPYHELATFALRLGNQLESDPDGQPDIAAEGDTLANGFSTDDGVFFAESNADGDFAAFVCTSDYGVRIRSSATGKVDAFLDFNVDGDFNDPDEKILNSVDVVSGDNDFTFDIPCDAVADSSYARVRLSTAGGLSFTGPATDGEVEDYLFILKGFDYGDAPASYGDPRHEISPDYRLGIDIDEELGTQGSLDALGDDNDIRGDDEDGITFINRNGGVPGGTFGFDLFLSNPNNDSASLSLYIDYNRNGVFDESTNEDLFGGIPQALSVGTNQFRNPQVPAIPVGAVPGVSYARFRLYNGFNVVTPTNDLEVGEVEDYVFIIGDLDFGDLPEDGSPYPTSIVNGGAYHVIVPNCELGGTVDSESDGQPSVAANGDTGDDGIAFTTSPWEASSTETLLVGQADVSGCPAARLYCYADFNGNNSFADPGETIVSNGDVSSAPVSFPVSVPANVVDDIFVRCRLGTSGANVPDGRASDGEVEDYVVTGSLPVELGGFEAASMPEGVHLKWSTLSETDNAGFHVELRPATCAGEAGCAWQEVAFVEGAGTTAELHEYGYMVYDLAPGIYAFRLKQIDFDGTTAYSSIVEASRDVPGDVFLAAAYPNPFSTQTSLRFSVAERQEASVNVYDLQGRLVRTLFEGRLEAGLPNEVTLRSQGLVSGAYIIALEGERGRT